MIHQNPITVFLWLAVCSSPLWAQNAGPSLIPADSLIVESIFFLGNDHTKEDILLREMQLRAGDYFDPVRAEQDRQRIQNLGLFHRVEIQLLKGENGLVLCVIVTERWYIFPIPILFLNNRDWEKLSYGLGLTWENLWGRNITTTGSCWFGFYKDVRLRYYNPWAFGAQKIIFDASVFNGRMPHLSANYPDFDITRRGIDLIFGKRNGYRSTFYISLGYQEVLLHEYREFSLSGTGYDHLPQAGLQFFYDRRDYYAYPKKGWYVLASGQIVNDGGSVHYGKIRCDIRRYQPIFADISVGGRACFDVSAGKMPIYEHTIIGLQERVRGHFYDMREGENRFLGSVECRFPILPLRYFTLEESDSPYDTYGKNLPFGISGGLFIDTGAVWDHNQAMHPDRFNSGYGLGLHFHLPYLELLRFERAWDFRGHGEYIADLKVWF